MEFQNWPKLWSHVSNTALHRIANCGVLRLLLLLGCIGGPILGLWLAPQAFATDGVWVGFGIGASASGTIVYFIREYFLYLVKAEHIAVLVELMEGRKLPKGKSQLGYAKDIVARRFTRTSSLP